MGQEGELDVYSPPPGLREVGHAASWSVTSAKPGNGVDALRDGRTDTFWQSDGLQPHVISIQFDRRMSLLELHLYVDYKLDESYTPNKLSVQAGNTYQDVKEIKVVELEEPSGWVVVQLGTPLPDAGPGSHEDQAQPACALIPLQAHLLQLSILSNHQNGRDTHVRAVRVYGSVPDHLQQVLRFPLPVTSPEMAMYAQLR